MSQSEASLSGRYDLDAGAGKEGGGPPGEALCRTQASTRARGGQRGNEGATWCGSRSPTVPGRARGGMSGDIWSGRNRPTTTWTSSGSQKAGIGRTCTTAKPALRCSMPDHLGQSVSRGWRRTVVLKDLLGDDSSDAATRIAAEGFAKRLKRLPEYESDFELEQIVGEFEDVAHADSSGDDVFGGRFTLCDWFNAVLSNLYDWADAGAHLDRRQLMGQSESHRAKLSTPPAVRTGLSRWPNRDRGSLSSGDTSRGPILGRVYGRNAR